MYIYAENITPRLRYVTGFIFGDLLGLPAVLTDDPAEIIGSDRPAISYSTEKAGDSLHIMPSGLLSENGVRAFIPQILTHDGICLLFPEDRGDFPFDVFSAAFYMITRYEEYLPYQADRHGRFPASQSLAARHGFLEDPVVNQWAGLLAKRLKDMFPDLKTSPPKSVFRPSIDIDTAWVVKHRSVYRTIGGLVRHTMRGGLKSTAYRLEIIRGKRPDPFDSYQYIRQRHGSDLLVFMLAGPGGKYNLNNPVSSPGWRRLVKNMASSFTVGFHPSYHTSENLRMFRKERRILERITATSLKYVRQHFLRVSFPDTYRRIHQEGFLADYSLGFADRCGFRAGTCSPFRFYDLQYDRETSLMIFPFILMDRTLKDYMELEPDEAVRLIGELAGKVKKYGGYFIPIWHNDSLAGSGEWEGWRDVYENMLMIVKEDFGDDKIY